MERQEMAKQFYTFAFKIERIIDQRAKSTYIGHNNTSRMYTHKTKMAQQLQLLSVTTMMTQFKPCLTQGAG